MPAREGTALPPIAAVTRSLGARALSGLKWGGLSAVVGAVLQLTFTAAMARLLEPADFGLMAMCVVALRLFSYFSQLGLGAALVQRERLAPDDIRLALGLTWVVCTVGALGVMAAAPLLGWFFRSPGVVPILMALAPNLLLTGLAAVPAALLRRELRFGALALVETASYGLGFGVVGVVTAWSGAGVWSLVAATFGQSILALAGAYALTRHPLRPSLRGDRHGLIGYGARHSFISFIEFASANIDAALIGRLVGETALGLYSRALVLTNQPVERAAGILARVLFPLLSMAQTDRRKVGSVFLLSVAGIGVFGGAVSLGLSAAAGDVVRAILGPKWGESVPLAKVLALSVPFMFMSNVAGVVSDALALLAFKLRVQVSALAAITIGMLALYPAGAVGIAWAIVIGEALRFSMYLVFLARELHCAPADVARVLGAVGVSSALAYGACFAAASLAASRQLDPVTALGTEVAGGLVALLAGAWLALKLFEGTVPARLAETSLPGWQRLLARAGMVTR